MASPQTPDDADALLRSLRDSRRSARRWQNLLSPADRHRMLASIARVALAIGQDVFPSHDLSDLDIGGASGREDVCPRERLAFLTSAWPRLSNALRLIEAAPATLLIPGTRDVRTEQGSLKRVSPAAVLAAIRSGDFVSVSASASPLAYRLRGRLPRRIAETVTAPTGDTPVNRAVKAILVQIARDVGHIALLAQATDASGVARQAEALREMVRHRLRRDPWQSLPIAPVQNAYPPTSSPAYRYVFQQWRRYRASFAFDWANPLFALPARETWLLYEYSCLFAVADALRNTGYRAASAEGFALSRSGLTFALAKGRASRLVFRKDGKPQVTLRYNLNFPREGTAVAEGWRSRSHSLRPDISLEVNGRLLLFDAKFKTYSEPSPINEGRTEWQFRDGALLTDIQQMHTYRDAIVYDTRENVVSEAWLLYAGRIGVTNPEIVAYPQATTAEPFGVGKVGAILLRPNSDPGTLRELLRWFLEKQKG